MRLHQKIVELTHDVQVNTPVVAFRNSSCQPYAFRVRHRNLKNLKPNNASWFNECKVMARYGVKEKELKSIAKQVKGFLDEVRRRESKSSSFSNKDHPLISDTPLAEIADHLNTPKIIAAGIGVPFMGNGHEKRRAARIEEDQLLLGAIMLLVVNAHQQGDGVFTISYSLAVGSFCLA